MALENVQNRFKILSLLFYGTHLELCNLAKGIWEPVSKWIK